MKVPQVRLIEAGAGSGKTTRLAQEVFAAVRDHRARPEGILLTTFTRRAASELMDRVCSLLVASGLSREAVLVRRARIGTVNSVCGALLSEYAFDAGLPVRQRVIPEEEEKLLFDSALSLTLTGREAELLQEHGRSLSVEDWRDDVRGLAAAARSNGIGAGRLAEHGRESFRLIEEVLPPALDGREELRGLLEEAVREIERLVSSGKDGTRKTRETLELYRGLLQSRGGPVWADYHRLCRAGAGRRSGADGPAQRVREAAGRHHLWPEFRAGLKAYIESAFDLASRCLDGYASLKESAGLIDFTDQEALCLELLRRQEVRSRLREELDLVLVDEFQDTSPIQLDLFLRLAECARESVWVGDPKQAIYGFRGTDPELMMRVVAALPGQGERERLKTSYRSRPELVGLANAVFPPLFARQGLDPQRVPLEPAPRARRLDGPALESWVLQSSNKGGDLGAVAAGVAALLRRPRDVPVYDRESRRLRPLRPGDVAILARQNADCGLLAEALSAAGVPFRMETSGLLARPECRLAVEGLKLMLDPGDSFAAASLSFLWEVEAGRGSPEDWLSRRVRAGGEDAPAGKEAPGKEAPAGKGGAGVGPLLAARERLPLLSPREALELAMDRAGCWELTRRLPDSREASGALHGLLLLAAEYERSGREQGHPVSHAGLVQRLARLRDAGGDTLPPSSADAVRISTWHGAKGQEWPLVVLCTLDYQPPPRFYGVGAGSRRSIDLDRPLADRYLRLLPFAYRQGTRGSAYHELLEGTDAYARSAALDAAEHARLLYVAVTRARDYLVFAARRGQLSGLCSEGRPSLEVPQDPQAAPPGWTVRVLEEAEAGPGAEAVRWQFGRRPAGAAFPAAQLSPSALPAPDPGSAAAAVRVEAFAGRVPLPPGVEMDRFGEAVHRYLAAETAGLDRAARREIATALLEAYCPEAASLAGAVVRRGEELALYLERRWPAAAFRREWPLACTVEGRVLSGRADLVVEGRDSFVVIDYKSYPGREAALRQQAWSYACQLAAYSRALERSLDKRCAGRLICFAVTGRMAEIEVADADRLLREAVLAATSSS